MCRSIFVHGEVQNVCRIWIYLLKSMIFIFQLKNDANPTISLELGFIILRIILLPDFYLTGGCRGVSDV